jgi:predicted nicotinamide N-methyase
MVYYIRFLKTPRAKLHSPNSTGAWQCNINSTIAVTTDLRDGLCQTPTKLYVTLVRRLPITPRNQDNTILGTGVEVQWKEGMRALPVEIKFRTGGWEQLGMAIAVLVSASAPGSNKPMPEDQCLPGDNLSRGSVPTYISVLSDVLMMPFPLPKVGESWKGKGVGPWAKDIHVESGYRMERRFMLREGKTLRLSEETGQSLARNVWDAGLAMTAYLSALSDSSSSTSSSWFTNLFVSHSTSFSPLRILELGCGIGTVGIAMAMLLPNVQVLLTDLPDAMPILELNTASNLPFLERGSTLAQCPYDWYDAVPPETLASTKFDLIVVSDCTYNLDSLPMLVRALNTLLARSPGAKVVLSTKFRHPDEKAFFDMMAKAGEESGVEELMERHGMQVSDVVTNPYDERLEHVDFYVYGMRDKDVRS